MMNINWNPAINTTLMHHEGVYKKIEKRVPGAPFSFSEPSEFRMFPPAENLGNGRVILRYYAPDAKSVAVVGGGGSFPGTHPMTKDEDGYWSVTVTTTPGIHVHRYLVDGVTVLSSSMPLVFAAAEPANAFECVDEDCAWYLQQDVPHGDLRMEYYRSSYTGRWKVAWVYTPAGYDESTEDYPVLYLQHGAGEDETGWIDMGKAHLILDNMIAAGECEKMICVMNSGWSYREDDERSMMSGGFEQELVHDCIPFIEGKYRVRRDRLSRAMAGLSMGSSQSQRIVYHNPELFAYLGVIIGGFGQRWLGDDQKYLEDYDFLKKNLKLLFSSNGEQEDFCEASRAQIRKLQENGVPAVFYSTPGYHELTVCRKSLREFLPRLFR